MPEESFMFEHRCQSCYFYAKSRCYCGEEDWERPKVAFLMPKTGYCDYWTDWNNPVPPSIKVKGANRWSPPMLRPGLWGWPDSEEEPAEG